MEGLILILVLIIIIIVGSYITGKINSEIHRNLYILLGKGFVRVWDFPGTLIHEFGHLIAAILFRHKIERVKIICKENEEGLVSTTYNKRSLYQRMGLPFIALGPIISGFVVILLILYVLMPDLFRITIDIIVLNENLKVSFEGLVDLFDMNLIYNLNFWLFILLISLIIPSVSLSNQDIKNIFKGVLNLVVILKIFYIISEEIIFWLVNNMIFIQVLIIMFSLLIWMFTAFLIIIFKKT